jgi:hypothetical protein
MAGFSSDYLLKNKGKINFKKYNYSGASKKKSKKNVRKEKKYLPLHRGRNDTHTAFGI